jgi:hypothetical protein
MKRECAQNFLKSLDFRDESNALQQYSLRVSVGTVIVVAFFVAFFFVPLFFILFFFGPFSKQDPEGHRAINWVASDEF